MKLNGISALITGGASGLGAATARELTAAGAKCALLDLNMVVAEKTAKEIGAVAIECNVASEESAAKAIQAAAAKQGPARVLVNCAGIGTAGRAVGKNGPLALDAFAKTININLIGTFNLIRLAVFEMSKLPALDDGERGVVVNTASVAAFDGQIGQVAYSASKGGVVGMTLPLAREFASMGVRVCTIAPGLFDTPMMAGVSPEFKATLIASTLFPKRLGLPAEYGKLARHICENAMLNGETIRLDGSIRLAPK
ncbi:MAG TPA: SDR family NAD(P)-dependent oxidoreductase [Candidatus Cybelea sp.]|nr:SDR family NAD(P)-dependent oxidoreductase [Candidatus Cybelea sp.]